MPDQVTLPVIPDAEYHKSSFRNGGDYFSNSCLKLFARSPAILHQTRLGLLPWGSTDALRMGSLTHMIILEDAHDYVIIPDEHMTPSGGVSTKKATREWLASLEPGKLYATQREITQIQLMQHEVKQHDYAQQIMDGAEFERVARVEGPEVWLQSKIDIINHNKSIIGDLKTCNTLEDFPGNIRKHNYVRQMAFYRKLYRDLFFDDCTCYLIAVEKELPNRVGVWVMEDASMDAEESFINGQLRVLAGALEHDQWNTGYEQIRTYKLNDFEKERLHEYA